jgi:hypothetical protein
MIANFAFQHGAIKGMTPEKFAAVRQLVPTLPDDQVIAEKEYWYREFQAPISEVIALGVEVVLKKAEDPAPLWAVVQRLDQLDARIMNLRLNSSTSKDQMLNEKVSVHVPGLGLMAIDEVEVREDCCTDQLQTKLDEGWRILAVCPQPDRRRPDYVIGRTRREPKSY